MTKHYKIVKSVGIDIETIFNIVKNISIPSISDNSDYQRFIQDVA